MSKPQPPAHERPAKPAPHDVIDWKRALAAVDGDSELLHDLLRIFANEAPVTLEKLRAAVELKDASAIQLTAHTLKGSVANFGADDTVQAALRLEVMVRKGDMQHVTESFHDLEKEIQRVLAAIGILEGKVAG